MNRIDLTGIELEKVVTHHIGNKLRDEKYLLSDEITVIDRESTEFILKYFLQTLKTEEMYRFDHVLNTDLNNTYSVVKGYFQSENTFIDASKDLAKLLYEKSMHPKIKGGELNITHFSNIIIDDEVVEGIGIFKSESSVPFIKMKSNDLIFEINHEFGFEIKGIDKGCLVLNSDTNTGFRLLVVEKSSGAGDAQYWKNEFLNVIPSNNEYHQTQEFLDITKAYLTKQVPEDLEIDKTDKIDMLNRSIDYFKNRDNFNREEFEQEVFGDRDLVESFQNFNSTYKAENKLEISDDFEISNTAVKKQARVFKRVLKLDKNFHIYIHGDKNLIEKGTEPDGRKFYKIYFENET